MWSAWLSDRRKHWKVHFVLIGSLEKKKILHVNFPTGVKENKSSVTSANGKIWWETAIYTRHLLSCNREFLRRTINTTAEKREVHCHVETVSMVMLPDPTGAQKETLQLHLVLSLSVKKRSGEESLIRHFTLLLLDSRPPLEIGWFVMGHEHVIMAS